MIPADSILVITLPPGLGVEELFGENVITGGNITVSSYINSEGRTVVTITNFTGET